MPVQQVTKKTPSYTAVKVCDNTSKKQVVYLFPVGTKIATTNDQYLVKPGGIYHKGKKLEMLQLPMFDMAALKVLSNGDNIIDQKDSEYYVKAEAKNTNALATAINKELSGCGSSTRVKEVKDSEGSFSNAGVSPKGFDIIFGDGLTQESKSLEIKF